MSSHSLDRAFHKMSAYLAFRAHFRRSGFSLLSGLLLLVAACQQISDTSSLARPPIEPVRAALSGDDLQLAFELAQPLAADGVPAAEFVVGYLSDIGAGARLDHVQALVCLERAGNHGHVQACRYLAWKYSTGFGVEKTDSLAAASWRLRAGNAPLSVDVPERWLTGSSSGDAEPNFPRILQWLLARGERGELTAQLNLADVYLDTFWVATDPSAHLHWLRKAADQGHARSLERLADDYETGTGVGVDRAQALAYRQYAAEHGSVRAQARLGAQYAEGDGAQRNLASAARWYKLAADQGDVPSMVALAVLLRDGSDEVPQDLDGALRLILGAAEHNNVEAFALLGDFYYSGTVVPQNYAAAFDYYKRAATAGHVRSMSMLSAHYFAGNGVALDFTEARRWCQQAAERGDLLAMRNLSYLYRDGQGGPIDWEQAFTWLERAAKKGDLQAQVEVAEALHQGKGVPQDDIAAVRWFQLAAEGGEPRAHAQLALYYTKGIGVSPSATEAMRHAIAAARKLDDTGLLTQMVAAFEMAPPYEKIRLREMLLQSLAEPNLLQMEGGLPEFCLDLMEMGIGANLETEIRQLLDGMKRAERLKSLMRVARHSFLGWSMPYDLQLARRFVRAASKFSPKDSGRALAEMDSVSAPTETERAAAVKTMRSLADAGDSGASFTVAYWAITGLVGEADRDIATKYYDLALAQSGPDHARFLAKRRDEFFEQYVDVPSDGMIVSKLKYTPNRGGADAPPVTIFESPVIYPREMRQARQDGQATVRFTIDVTGHPIDMECVSGSHPLFAASAMAGVKRCRFAPRLEQGKPVPIRVTLTVTFTLAQGARLGRLIIDPPESVEIAKAK